MTVETPALQDVIRAAFEAREEPGRWVSSQSSAVARACKDMAARFHAGGRLLVFGNGGPATDARHVAVEFVHPVIVGKRPLPALSLAGDVATVTGVARMHGFDEVFAHQVRTLARPDDIVLGISADGRCTNVARGLRTAADLGALTLALTGGDGGGVADAQPNHLFVVPSENPLVVKEIHVTLYHLLWELVHVFLDRPAPTPAVGDDAEPSSSPGGVEGLYPFLYGGSEASGDLEASAAGSSEEKAGEVVALRGEASRHAESLAECAASIARCVSAGATVYTFGNGGSSTDADDLAASFSRAEPVPVPSLSLSADTAVITALANDVGIDVVFARPLAGLARKGDVAVGLSTSGNSGNVVGGLLEGRRRELLTVGFAGYDGGAMAQRQVADHLFVVPSPSVHRVQETQTTLYHVLVEATAAALR